MDNEQIMPKKDEGTRLNLELGNQLSVTIDEEDQPFRATMMGLDPLYYLILKIAYPKEFEKYMRPGTNLTVKYTSLGAAYGFTTQIIDHIDVPFALTFVSYPTKIDNLDSRAQSRVTCYIPATANMKDKDIKGIISDISAKGCRFFIKLPVNLQPKQVMLIDKILLYFPVMGLHGLQAFDGKVRNTLIDKEKIAMGIEFVNLSDTILQGIEEYIQSVAKISAIGPLKAHC